MAAWNRSDSRSTDASGYRTAMSLILLLGLVSAFGDLTYESARSVTGPFFLTLGASAAAVGFVAGLGELLGYGLRLVFGMVADRFRAYWTATFIGYGLLISVPLLALAYDWRVAAVLLILERVGKAVRSPSRDTILSHATHQIGRGWGFALHEFMDQTGAVIGPLLLAVVFFRGSGYRTGFALLLIPAVLAMITLIVARVRTPHPEELEETREAHTASEVEAAPTTSSRLFRLYAGFTFLSVTGFAAFPILSFHWVHESVVSASGVAILYALAMGVDAVVALAAGKAYDRFGLKVLVAVPLFTVAVPFAGLQSKLWMIGVGAVLWGCVMALHETIMRAAVADLSDIGRRATAYGIFNLIYGAGWFAGSTCIGWLYDRSLVWVGIFVVAFEGLALLGFLAMHRAAAGDATAGSAHDG